MRYVVLAVLVALFVVPNVDVFAVDSYFELQVAPAKLLRALFFAWDPFRHPGSSNLGNQSYAFPYATFYAIANFGLGAQHAFAATLWAMLSVAACGCLTLLTSISSAFQSKRDSILSVSLSLFYALNPYTFIVITSTASVSLLPYAALPWIVWSGHAFITSGRPALLAIFCLSVTLSGGINLPLTAINAVVMLAWILIVCSQTVSFKKLVLRSTLMVAASAATNAWWLIGLLYHLFFVVSLDEVLSESIEWLGSAAKLSNVFSLLGVWGFDGEHAGKKFYPYSQEYLHSPIVVIALFGPVLATVAFLTRAKTSYVNRNSVAVALALTALLILAVSMVASVSGPFGGDPYRWLYANMPGFAMFRSNYKFATVIVFISVLAFWLLACTSLWSRRRSCVISGLVSAFVAVVWFSPLGLHGLIRSEMKLMPVPSSYLEIRDFLSDTPNAVVMLLPEQYFASFRWGRTLGNPEGLYVDKVLTATPGSPDKIENQLFTILNRALLASDDVVFCPLAARLGVTHVAYRKDFSRDEAPIQFRRVSEYAGIRNVATLVKETAETALYAIRCKGTDAAVNIRMQSPVDFAVDLVDSGAAVALPVTYDHLWRAYRSDALTNLQSLEPITTAPKTLAHHLLWRPLEVLRVNPAEAILLRNSNRLASVVDVQQRKGVNTKVTVYYFGQVLLLVGYSVAFAAWMMLFAWFVLGRSRAKLK